MSLTHKTIFNRKCFSFFLGVLSVFEGFQLATSDLTLAAPSESVTENSSLELTCSYTGTKTVQAFDMTLGSHLQGSLLSDCSIFLKLPDPALYKYTCPTNNQFKWTVAKVTRANEGNIWTCQVYIVGGSEIATYTVHVDNCASKTAQFKRSGGHVSLQFQATTVSSENAILAVANMILSPSGSSQLLNVLYRNGSHIITSDCHGCTFTGNAATGNISLRIDNLQASDGGTYKHVLNSNGNVLACATVYILGIPTRPELSVSTEPSVGENVTLTCVSTSTTTPRNHGLSLRYSWSVDNVANPSDSRYTYSSDRSKLKVSALVKEDISKNFTCSAREDINEGYTSNSSDSVRLNVLYPPDGPPKIEGYKNGGTYKVLENNKGLLSCAITGGNPLATLSWDCYNAGLPETTAGTTVIKNVTWTASRDQERMCTCYSSHMIDGKKNVSVKIEILYQASVNEFFVEGNRQDKVIIDEHDDVNLTCDVDSNPASSIKVLFGNNVLKETSSAKTLSFVHKNVACLYGGIYTCEASNGYGKPSNRTLKLFVRCSPRPLHQVKENFTSFLYQPVTLSVEYLAYPEPGATGYTWYKEIGSRWSQMLGNADILISSSGLQSSLTILNVSQSDFGQYRLTVVNSVGNNDQFLYLTEDHIQTTETAMDTGTCSCDKITQAENTVVIVGATLGLLSFVSIIYGIIVTVFLKRNTSRKDTQPLDKPASQTTYANLEYTPNTTEELGGTHSGTSDETRSNKELGDKQYTSLDPFTREDKTEYTDIQTQ